MKRQRSSSTNKQNKKQRTDSSVPALVRKELRKNTDWLYADYQVTSNAIYYNAAPVSILSNLQRGDNGLNSFAGNIIKPQAITIKYFATSPTSEYQALRFIVFQWFDAATPATSGILQNTSQTTALVSPTLITNKQYIKILYDKLHVTAISAAGDGLLGDSIIDGQTIYIPGKRLRNVRFASGSNTVQDGNIYVLALSDDTALSTINLTMYARVTFADQ